MYTYIYVNIHTNLKTDNLSLDVVKKISANLEKNSSLEYLLNRKMSRQYEYGDNIPYSKISFSENYGNHNQISTKRIQGNTHTHLHDYCLPPITNLKQKFSGYVCTYVSVYLYGFKCIYTYIYTYIFIYIYP
jgi:hypothetical protein